MDAPRKARQLSEETYTALRRIAHAHMARGGRMALQPTSVVHEVWLRIGAAGADLERQHFLSLAARAMRQVVIDHARAQAAQKRGGDRVQVTLSDVGAEGDSGALVDVLALDAALQQLAALDPRRARVVELKFFGGMQNAEIAAELGTSTATVERDWRAARAWLHTQL